MKSLFLKSITLCICILFISCAKNKDEPAPETPVTPAVSKGSFTWQATPGSAVTADSAYYYSQITTIFAFKTGNSNSVEINLSALSAGSYSFSSTTGNTFSYVSGSVTYNAVSGSCNITAAANNKLSGNFSVNLSGGSITAINGTFTDILKK